MTPAKTLPLPPALTFEGHAIVSADGMIADAAGLMPAALRNKADYALFQAALDRATLVVLGRRGHQRHPNAGRQRLVMTGGVVGLVADPGDAQSHFWNPATKPLPEVLAALGIAAGIVAITGGTRGYDYFASLLHRFSLAESNALVLPGGTPCFSVGHPRIALAAAGLVPGPMQMLDATAAVSLTAWRRIPSPLRAEGGA